MPPSQRDVRPRTQTESGKGFECAIVRAFISRFGDSNVMTGDVSTYLSVERCFQSFSLAEQTEMVESALPVIDFIIDCEPHLQWLLKSNEKLYVTVLGDRAGVAGDVRDIVLSNAGFSDCAEDAWSVGISAKNNHEALKAPRLSPTIDFGLKWLGIPCSEAYFREVGPVFKRLSEYKARGELWSNLPDKGHSIYEILCAFTRELVRLDSENQGAVAARLIKYLVGRKDFYKILKRRNSTKLQVFNIHGELNRSLGRLKPSKKLERVKLPTKIIQTEIKNAQDSFATTLIVIMDSWQISMRLHSAKSVVEPSLKFDINLDSLPRSLETFSF